MSYAGVESEDDYQARKQAQRRRATYAGSAKGRAEAAQREFDERLRQLEGRLRYQLDTVAEFKREIPKLRRELAALRAQGPVCDRCGLTPCDLYPCNGNYARIHATYPEF